MKFDINNSNPEGGGLIEKTGVYHLRVTNSKETDENAEIGVEILRAEKSENADQVGRTTNLWMSWPHKSQNAKAATNALLHLACAVNIYSYEQWAKDKESGISPELDFGSIKGQTFIGKIEVSEVDSKKTPGKKQTYRNLRESWNVTNPERPKFELDQQAIKEHPSLVAQGSSALAGW